MKKEDIQKIRNKARGAYQIALALNATQHDEQNTMAYEVYCDALDVANQLEGKKKIKR